MKFPVKALAYFTGASATAPATWMAWNSVFGGNTGDFIDYEEAIEEIFEEDIPRIRRVVKQLKSIEGKISLIDPGTEHNRGTFGHSFAHHFLSVQTDKNTDIWDAKEREYLSLLNTTKEHVRARRISLGFSDPDKNLAKDWCEKAYKENYQYVYQLKEPGNAKIEILWKFCSKWETKPTTIDNVDGHLVTTQGNDQWWKDQALAVFGKGNGGGTGEKATKGSGFEAAYQEYKGKGDTPEAVERLKQECAESYKKISSSRNEDTLRFCSLMGYFPQDESKNPFAKRGRTMGEDQKIYDTNYVLGTRGDEEYFSKIFKYHMLGIEGNVEVWKERTEKYKDLLRRGLPQGLKSQAYSSAQIACNAMTGTSKKTAPYYKQQNIDYLSFVWKVCSVEGEFPRMDYKYKKLVSTLGNQTWWEAQSMTFFEGTGSKASPNSSFSTIYQRYKGRGNDTSAVKALQSACRISYAKSNPEQDPDTLRFCSLTGYEMGII